MELCAQSLKRVSLEIGGKSANIILEDADLAAAIPAGVFGCYLNSGQVCSALNPHARPPLQAGRGRGARPKRGGGVHAR